MKMLDISGERFERLLAIRKASQFGRSRWVCRCDCGATVAVDLSSLRRGMTTSCGCYQRERAALLGKSTKKHGLWNHPLYNIFMKIRERCENPKNHAHRNYGGRGIECRFSGPLPFIRWALANGYAPRLTIDREDNNGHYSPSNCRWVTMKVQQRNRRNNRILEINGILRCVSEWAEAAGISNATVAARLKDGWTAQQAVMTPVNKLFSHQRA